MKLQDFPTVYLDLSTKYTTKHWIKCSSLEIIGKEEEISGFLIDFGLNLTQFPLVLPLAQAIDG